MVKIMTEDGRIVVGRIVNYGGGEMSVRTNQLEPWKLTPIKDGSVQQITPSTTWLMPAGLLDVLSQQDVFDMLGWLSEQ